MSSLIQNEDYYLGYEKLKYGNNKGCCKGRMVTGPKRFAKTPIVLLNTVCLYINISWYGSLAPIYFNNDISNSMQTLCVFAMIFGIIT